MAEPIATRVPLQPLNTLALPAEAGYFLRAECREALADGLRFARARRLPLLILGEGSNLVLTGDFPGLCLQVATRGVEARGLDEDWVEVRAEAGERWHDFVAHCLAQGWYGLENLALIPGTVGAAPIQNIGAYGVEVKDFIARVELLDIVSGQPRTLEAEACGFGYRDSVFKGALRDRCLITAVSFRLRRTPALALGYAALAEALAPLPLPGPRDLFEAVVRIRQAKLPDPRELPNAGSFFKNPVVDHDRYQALRRTVGEMPAYPDPRGVKLAAGWLIDRAGWKGHRQGAVGVHAHQALVLVNRGGATGAELLALAGAIQQDIRRRFGVDLEIEPRIY